MAAKGFRHTGLLPGTDKRIASSSRCMVYNHRRDLIYLSTDSPSLAIEIVCTQRERDPKGDYKAYELAGGGWSEIGVKLQKPPSSRRLPPPLFLL